MKATKSLVIAAICTAATLISGCTTGDQPKAQTPQKIENVAYTLAPGRTFESAVSLAATRRRWIPHPAANGSVRCELVQREHRVVVDVIPSGNTFSIVCVESNIPVKKYDQWVNNLCREIVARAAK